MLALLLSLVLGLTLRWVPDSDGARLWALAFAPLAAGQALKIVEVDTTLQLVLRDPLILTGFALLLTGLRQYLALPRLWLPSVAIVLGSLIANALFTAVWPLPAAREAVRLAGMAVLGLACVAALRELREAALRPVRDFLQGVFGLIALLSLLRLALLPLEPGAPLAMAEDLARLVQGLLLLAALLGLMLLLTARMNLMLGRLSMHDALTGVLNRRGLDEAAQTTLAFARRVGRPVGLLLCDLDRFKAINDTHGHALGDEALKAFAELLREQFDGADLIGRIGGEEFALLLPGAGPREAMLAAEALRQRVAAQPLLLPAAGTPLRLTVSIGVLSQPAQEASWGAMLAQADAALYEAKARGRDRCVLAGEDTPAAAGRLPPAPAGAGSA